MNTNRSEPALGAGLGSAGCQSGRSSRGRKGQGATRRQRAGELGSQCLGVGFACSGRLAYILVSLPGRPHPGLEIRLGHLGQMIPLYGAARNRRLYLKKDHANCRKHNTDFRYKNHCNLKPGCLTGTVGLLIISPACKTCTMSILLALSALALLTFCFKLFHAYGII